MSCNNVSIKSTYRLIEKKCSSYKCSRNYVIPEIAENHAVICHACRFKAYSGVSSCITCINGKAGDEIPANEMCSLCGYLEEYELEQIALKSVAETDENVVNVEEDESFPFGQSYANLYAKNAPLHEKQLNEDSVSFLLGCKKKNKKFFRLD